MAADVVGFSRLMSEEEVRTFVRVTECLEGLVRTRVEAEGGRIFKLMGDGLLAEFPSVISAVQAAIAVQRAMEEDPATADPASPLQLRIGISLGDMIPHGQDLFGEGVNVAARVEALTPPGGICVTRAVHDQILGKIKVATQDWGEIPVKNIKRPVHVFRILHDNEEMPALAAPEPPRSGRRWRVVAASAAALAALALWPTSDQGLPTATAPGPVASAETAASPTTPRIEAAEAAATVRTAARLRAAPTTRSAVVGGLAKGMPVRVTGTVGSGDDRWLQVQRPSGRTAFLHASLAEFGEAERVDSTPSEPSITSGIDAAMAGGAEVLALATPVDPETPAAPETRDEAPVTSADQLALRVSLVTSPAAWSSCISLDDANKQLMDVAGGASWQQVHLFSSAAQPIRARVETKGDGARIQVLPYADSWGEGDAITLNLPALTPGTKARAFSSRRAPPPYTGCGRFVAYVEVLDPATLTE
ncbi:MAG: SH3 domain-containing protein [Pseudomonadota bacterium]